MSKVKVKCKGRNRSGYWSYSSGYPQCTRAATTPAGYCKIHDPDIRKAKNKARAALAGLEVKP